MRPLDPQDRGLALTCDNSEKGSASNRSTPPISLVSLGVSRPGLCHLSFVDVEPDQMAALTAVERALVEHVARGVVLDLVGNETGDEPATRSWGESRTRTRVGVRDILRGRLAPDPDPHGVRLRGARIAGRLDLENITSTVALKLRGCLL